MSINAGASMPAANSAPPRVVITGLGAITPLALSAGATWEKLLAGESGIDHLTRHGARYDAGSRRAAIGGEVRNFDPCNYLDRADARRLDPYVHYAAAAAQEAIADAGLHLANEDPERVGVVIGTAIGGCGSLIETVGQAAVGLDGAASCLNPNRWVDSAAGWLAAGYNLQGPIQAVVSACASGGAACGEAFELLRRGDADMVLAGGAESPLLPIILAALDVMGALSGRVDDPKAACRPFDRDRDGFVLSEGAAVLVLETEGHARRRGAPIYAEVVGYGSSSDAAHMTAPHADGRGAVAAMRMALRKAAAYGVTPEQVGYINAHGTGTRLNDAMETLAIKKVLGERAYDVRVSSTKSMTGHLAGAAGALEALIGAKVIQTGMVPPTINLDRRDPACDLNYTPSKAVAADAGVVLSNSFGLWGHNACIVLRRYVREA